MTAGEGDEGTKLEEQPPFRGQRTAVPPDTVAVGAQRDLRDTMMMAAAARRKAKYSFLLLLPHVSN